MKLVLKPSSDSHINAELWMPAADWNGKFLAVGNGGFGVLPEAWLERWGPPLQPDLAVLAVFVGNDLQDAAPGVPKVEVEDGALVLAGEGRPSLGQTPSTVK